MQKLNFFGPYGLNIGLEPHLSKIKVWTVNCKQKKYNG